MTKYFEVVRRDGPARMGKLLTEPQISTPALITKDDYVSAGSVYSYASLSGCHKCRRGFQGSKEAGHTSLRARCPTLRAGPGAAAPGVDGPQGRTGPPLQRKRAGESRCLCAGQRRCPEKSQRSGGSHCKRAREDRPGHGSLCSRPGHTCQPGLAGVPGHRPAGRDARRSRWPVGPLPHPRWRLEGVGAGRTALPLRALPGDGQRAEGKQSCLLPTICKSWRRSCSRFERPFAPRPCANTSSGRCG